MKKLFEIDLSPSPYAVRLDPETKKYLIPRRRCPACGSTSCSVNNKDIDGDPVIHCRACGKWLSCKYY